MMKLKAKALEKLINESISDLQHGQHENEMFAIHNEGGIQVQIVVTTEDRFDNLAAEYESATE